MKLNPVYALNKEGKKCLLGYEMIAKSEKEIEALEWLRDHYYWGDEESSPVYAGRRSKEIDGEERTNVLMFEVRSNVRRLSNKELTECQEGRGDGYVIGGVRFDVDYGWIKRERERTIYHSGEKLCESEFLYDFVTYIRANNYPDMDYTHLDWNGAHLVISNDYHWHDDLEDLANGIELDEWKKGRDSGVFEGGAFINVCGWNILIDGHQYYVTGV